MSKGKKSKNQRTDLTTCKECGCQLKPENMGRHMSRVHGVEPPGKKSPNIGSESHTGSPEKNIGSMITSSRSPYSDIQGGNKFSKQKRRETRNTESRKAEARKLELMRRRRRNAVMMTMVMLAIVVIAIALSLSPDDDGNSSKPIKKISNPEADDIRFPKANITDEADFFGYEDDGVEIKIFGVRGSDGKEHVAFDACDVCYEEKKGYVQVDDVMKCNNCGQEFGINSIGTENVEGGCWPSYLPMTDDGDDIVMKGEDIQDKRWMFE